MCCFCVLRKRMRRAKTQASILVLFEELAKEYKEATLLATSRSQSCWVNDEYKLTMQSKEKDIANHTAEMRLKLNCLLETT